MSARQSELTARDIVARLAIKHADDVFVPECKNGPTQGYTGMCKLDAWAMARSWSKPVTTGYEIKVARSDFVGDMKWRRYLDYCSQFYFVCPKGLIAVEELPVDSGLIWVTPGTRYLVTKRVAPWREVTIPENLWRYILICRTRISTDADARRDTNVEFWRNWLECKNDRRELGYAVAKAIRDHVERVERNACDALSNAKSIASTCEYVVRACRELGVDITTKWSRADTVVRMVEAKTRLLSRDRVTELERARSALDAIIKEANEAHKALDGGAGGT